MRDDVFVRLINLPTAVKGVTLPNPDGTYSVYINSGLSVETQRHVLNHELYHIDHDHLYRNLPVAHAERAAGGTVVDVKMPEPIKPPVLSAIAEVSRALNYMSAEEYQQLLAESRRRSAYKRHIQQERLPDGYLRNRLGRVVCIDISK